MENRETVHEKLARNAYKNNLPYPTMARRSSLIVAIDETPALRDARLAYDAESQRLNTAFKTAQEAHGAETARLEAEFKKDLEAEYGMAKNPKKDKLYIKAWEHGHSSGLSEVASYYIDLLELVEG